MLDEGASTVAALPHIVERVAGRLDVLLDGGVRSGQDVLKAVALGAKACLLRRAPLYGLAAGGEEGVARVIELIRSELEFSAALTGTPDVRAATPAILWWRCLAGRSVASVRRGWRDPRVGRHGDGGETK